MPRKLERVGAWLRRNWLLWTLFVVGTFCMVKSSSDRLPAWLRGTAAEPLLSQFPTGNQIIFDLALGSSSAC